MLISRFSIDLGNDDPVMIGDGDGDIDGNHDGGDYGKDEDAVYNDDDHDQDDSNYDNNDNYIDMRLAGYQRPKSTQSTPAIAGYPLVEYLMGIKGKCPLGNR